MPLLTTTDAGVLALTLNRPEKRNALNAASVEALLVSLEQARLDPAVQVVTIGGAGTDFCAGADLDELLASADLPPDQNERHARRLGEVFLAIRELEKPVVALVQGRALAGGAGLAAACDLVVAADSAQLGYPEIHRGFVPAMVMTMLRRQVGERVAFDLAATGRILGAEEARQLGLVSRVLPEAAFAVEARAVVHQLAQSSPSALALTKRLLYQLDGLSFRDGIALGARINALARMHPDARAAIEQFLKR
jgi:methylglutaconyl-CoA hydratase